MRVFEFLRDKFRSYDDGHNFTCDICSREVFKGERVCAECRKTLPWNNGVICPLCGRKVGEPGICLECKAELMETDKARSLFLYEGEAARLVLRFKDGQRYLVRACTELLLPLVRSEFPDANALTFVPMTARAEKKRGYNQSRLLAEALSVKLGIPCYAFAEKRHETAAQKSLGRSARAENLKGSFHVTDRKGVKGARILIVDDTMTTGATASELAGCFRRAGAERVYLVTLTSVEKKFAFGDTRSEKERRRSKCR